jgi:hypothetical protein
MAKITKNGAPITDDEYRRIMAKLGKNEAEIEFMLAMEKGEVGGDIVVVDRNGKETYLASEILTWPK